MNNLDQKNNQQLEKAIVSAVAYFDIFDFPLTFFEIWQNLYFEKEGCQKFSLTDVSGKLNELIKQNVVEKKDGFYFFSGRAEIIKTRLDRYKLAEKKYHLALKIAKIFSFIPFVKLTAICNSLAYANSRRGSDIDFFIVTREKRIWLTRLITIAVTKSLNLRPKKNNTKNKICLSFLISEKNLNLKKISLGDDIYLKYWINQIYPIYNPAYIYQKFCQENSWIAGYFNSSQAILPPLRRKIEKSKINLLAFLNLPLFNFLERLAKIFQLAVLPKDLKNLTNRDGRVIINDQMLKFHPNDRREEYRKMFEKKLASLGY